MRSVSNSRTSSATHCPAREYSAAANIVVLRVLWAVACFRFLIHPWQNTVGCPRPVMHLPWSEDKIDKAALCLEQAVERWSLTTGRCRRAVKKAKCRRDPSFFLPCFCPRHDYLFPTSSTSLPGVHVAGVLVMIDWG